MDLYALKKKAQQSPIDQINILSHEGGIYIAEILLEKTPHILTQKNSSKPYIFHSIEEVKDHLTCLHPHHFNLVQSSPHDEMVGFPPHYDDNEAMNLTVDYDHKVQKND